MAWDISDLDYDDVSLDVSTEMNSGSRNIKFGDSGAKLYVVDGDSTTTAVYQYNLTTDYDLSTASYASKSYTFTQVSSTIWGLDFKSDGSKCYITDIENNIAYQYSLSTEWDISTASYDSKSFDFSSIAGILYSYSLAFKSDGTKMYFQARATNSGIYQYSLSTAWDISTASYDNKVMETDDFTNNYSAAFVFGDSGSKIYGVDYYVRDSVFRYSVRQYDLSTAWDVSTASFTSNEEQTTFSSSEGIDLNSDGTKMYVESSNDNIYQFSLGTSENTFTPRIIMF